MKSFILMLTVYFLFTACNPDRIYEKHLEPDSALEWSREDTLEYLVDIADTSQGYDIYVAIRYAQGYPFEKMRMELLHRTPSGNQRFQLIEIPMTDEKGNYRGEGLGDIWDLEHTVAKDHRFREKGIHSFRLVHDMPAEPVPLIMEVGMALDAVDPDAQR